MKQGWQLAMKVNQEKTSSSGLELMLIVLEIWGNELDAVMSFVRDEVGYLKLFYVSFLD